MRPNLPICCALLLAACIKEEPPNGTFVGNPGTLTLTAARTTGFVTEDGSAVLAEMSVLSCDGSAPTLVDLEDATVLFDGMVFTTEPPVRIPQGIWCGLELQLATLSFDVIGDEANVQYVLDFDDIAVRVTGPELVVEGQTFSLELARMGWLSILAPNEDGSEVVDVRTEQPDIWADIRDILINASALGFAPDPDDPVYGQPTVDQQEDAEVLWGGSNRPVDGTPTTTTPTTTDNDLYYVLQSQFPIFAPDTIDPNFRPSVAIGGEDIGIAYVGLPDASVQGMVVSVNNDIQYNDPSQLQRPGVGQPHLTVGPNGFRLVSSDNTAIFIDALIDGQFFEEQVLPISNASFPTCSDGDADLIAWLDDDLLRIASIIDPAINTTLAESVKGPISMASDIDGGLTVTWVETLTNPLTGDETDRLYVAVFDAAGTTLLVPIDASQPSQPRVAIEANHFAVAYNTNNNAAIDLHTRTGDLVTRLELSPEATDADVAIAGEALVVAYVIERQGWLQMFDTNGAATSTSAATEVIADRLDVAASFDGNNTWIVVAGSTIQEPLFAEVFRAEPAAKR